MHLHCGTHSAMCRITAPQRTWRKGSSPTAKHSGAEAPATQRIYHAKRNMPGKCEHVRVSAKAPPAARTYL